MEERVICEMLDRNRMDMNEMNENGNVKTSRVFGETKGRWVK